MVARSAQVAFLATGDELVHGDVLNTNAASMARVMVDHRIAPGVQCVVADDRDQIQHALACLSVDYPVIVVTGGLGPTSDDITRFAVASYWQVELDYHAPSWQRIEQRLQSRGIQVTENNRQQCLFPAGAQVLENRLGTADGCVLEREGHMLVLLPGPPRECLTLFEQKVLPLLLQRDLAAPGELRRFMLMGLGEGTLAQQLQPMVDGSDIEIGYRVCFPYIEVKFFAATHAAMAPVVTDFISEFDQYIVTEGQQEASACLLAWLCEHDVRIQIDDQATRGALMSVLSSPQRRAIVDFIATDSNYDYRFSISGLQAYWSAASESQDQLRIACDGPFQEQVEQSVRLLGARTVTWVREFCCWQLYRWLSRPRA